MFLIVFGIFKISTCVYVMECFNAKYMTSLCTFLTRMEISENHLQFKCLLSCCVCFVQHPLTLNFGILLSLSFSQSRITQGQISSKPSRIFKVQKFYLNESHMYLTCPHHTKLPHPLTGVWIFFKHFAFFPHQFCHFIWIYLSIYNVLNDHV